MFAVVERRAHVALEWRSDVECLRHVTRHDVTHLRVPFSSVCSVKFAHQIASSSTVKNHYFATICSRDSLPSRPPLKPKLAYCSFKPTPGLRCCVQFSLAFIRSDHCAWFFVQTSSASSCQPLISPVACFSAERW